MRDGAPVAEPTAPAAEAKDGTDSAAAALAAVFAVSPLAQAVFDGDGRCIAASVDFSQRAANAVDASGRLSPEFLAGADMRNLSFGGQEYRLVTLAAVPAAASEPSAPSPASLDSVLRGLLDSIPAAINAKDRELRYLYMNKTHAELWGVEPAAAVGRTHAELRGSPSEENAEHERRVLETGEAVPFFDENIAGADGAVRDWLVTKMPLKNPESGETMGVATVALDVSDRKRLEEALTETKKAAEAATRAKTLFLAQVSHELRTPLNAIIGFTEMMTQEIFGPLGARQYHGYATDVLKAARHLLGIITDMLDIAKLDAAALALELAPVAPAEIVAEAVRTMALPASNKRIALRQHVESALPSIKGDARRLRQAIINLLSNAVKFTPEGGAVLVGALRASEGGIEIFVEDNGAGMTPEEIETALLVFGRVREGYAKGQEGTGIGLPLAKALVERHGGKFMIDSAPGNGTKIRAVFPPSCLVGETKADAA